MRIPKRIRLVLLILLLLIVAMIIDTQYGFVGMFRSGRGEFCVQCGARYDLKSARVQFVSLSIPLASSARTNTTPLTALWEKYCGGCRHDWVF